MKFNKEDLKKIGVYGMTTSDLLQVLKTKITYLKWHNKNYTKKQWLDIQDIADLIEAIEL